MKMFFAVVLTVAALVRPVAAVPDTTELPQFVLERLPLDYSNSRTLYQDNYKHYAWAYKQIQSGGLGSGVAPLHMQRAVSDAMAKTSGSAIRIKPGSGGTIENGHLVVYGNNHPDVYRIQVLDAPQVNYYYKNLATQIHITISDGANKITYLVTPSGVQVVDAELPSIQANSSFVGLVGGTSITISKNDIFRGLGVLADFVNAQRGKDGLCKAVDSSNTGWRANHRD